MKSLRSRAVIAGLVIVLGLLGATLLDRTSAKLLGLGAATSIYSWVTAVVIGTQVVAVIVKMIRAAYLRRKEGTQGRRARGRRRN